MMGGAAWLFILVSLVGGITADNATTTEDPVDATVEGHNGTMGEDVNMTTSSEEDDDDDDDDDDEHMEMNSDWDLCCPLKMNGGKMYRLVSASEMAIKKYHCDSPCVYERMPGKKEHKRKGLKSRRVKRHSDDKVNWYCFKMSMHGADSKCAWFGPQGGMGDHETGMPGHETGSTIDNSDMPMNHTTPSNSTGD